MSDLVVDDMLSVETIPGSESVVLIMHDKYGNTIEAEFSTVTAALATYKIIQKAFYPEAKPL